MGKLTLAAFAGIAAVSLAACGDTAAEQAVFGAGAGAATAVVLDGDLATGAIIGAGANVLYCQQNPSKCN
jgi:uncharacterized lipoprotein YehR (DUF1307 family)